MISDPIIYISRVSGGILFTLSTSVDKKAGILAGIMIFLLVKTLSTKGINIPKETPSKIEEKIIQTDPIENRPR